MMKRKIKIEKGVPLPPARVTRSSNKIERERVYPFPDMKVKESFTFSKKMLNSVRNCASIFSRAHKDKKFTVRIVSPKKGRCWRTV